MKPIERAKVSLHEKSSIDDDFAPVETDSTIKVPGAAFNRSPIEVRVFGLPHNRSDAARAKLKRIFDNINKRGKKFDNGDEGYIEIGHFDIHEGEPDLQTSNTNKFQSTAKIKFLAARQASCYEETRSDGCSENGPYRAESGGVQELR